MTPNFADLPTLSRLLDNALALEPDAVDAWVEGLPDEHAHLRPALREMLASHRLQAHAHFMVDGPKLQGPLGDDTEAHSGDLVGPYCLIREIGRGGMGAVWLADRADGTLKRQVALKLPRLVWGASLAERMARERDIGALLAHPHIARLYDAGLDALGRPYLALEYVDGQPLDAWCEANALSVPQRLRLFLQVARAVAYAHGRLVVHRDLKPSNVLVTADGQAHLLDFGIARLLRESAPGDERLTQEFDRVMTPHYASPEQLQGEAITVASDVYSLGVLLYELLTGRHPHKPDRKGLVALQALVLEGEPRLASSQAEDGLTAKSLRGELDAILAKALKRQPGDRYATADAMAEDIERHPGGERVLAQPDSVGYRLAKALRRHRTGFAAAGGVLLAVLGGAGFSVVQAHRANDAAERARVVKEFVVDVFKVNERGKPANAELRQLPVELLLQRGAKLIETKFAGQPQLQAELYGVVGGIFADMGANELAANYATRQVETEVAIGAGPLELAQATMLLAQALMAQGRLADALPRAQRAVALTEHDPQLHPRALALLTQVMFRQGSYDEAKVMLDRTEQAMKGETRPTAVSARNKQLRAGLMINANHFDQAVPMYLSAIDEALAAEGPSSPTAIDIRVVLAMNLIIQRRMADARPQIEATLAALRVGGGAGEVRAALVESVMVKATYFSDQIRFEDAKAILERDRAALVAGGPLVPERIKASIDFDLGSMEVVWGDLKSAIPLIASGAALLRPQVESPRDRYQFADIHAILATHVGQHDQAEAFFREELDAQKSMGGADHPDRVFEYARWALGRAMQGHFDAAEAILASAPKFEALQGADPATVVAYRDAVPRTLARIKLERGEPAAALALLPAAADDDPDMPYPFENLLLRGEILCALGRRSEGLPLLERSLKIQEEKDYAHQPHLARERGVTGLCALATGNTKRAMRLAAQAHASSLEQPDASPYFRRPGEQLEALLRVHAAPH